MGKILLTVIDLYLDIPVGGGEVSHAYAKGHSNCADTWISVRDDVIPEDHYIEDGQRSLVREVECYADTGLACVYMVVEGEHQHGEHHIIRSDIVVPVLRPEGDVVDAGIVELEHGMHAVEAYVVRGIGECPGIVERFQVVQVVQCVRGIELVTHTLGYPGVPTGVGIGRSDIVDDDHQAPRYVVEYDGPVVTGGKPNLRGGDIVIMNEQTRRDDLPGC